MKKRGFVLLSSLLVVLMMLSFVSLLLLKTEAHIRTSRYAQNQMRSISLAEGGLEEARKIIAENPIAGLLKAQTAPFIRQAKSGFRIRSD